VSFARSIAEQGPFAAEVLDAAALTISKLWESSVAEAPPWSSQPAGTDARRPDPGAGRQGHARRNADFRQPAMQSSRTATPPTRWS